MLSQPKKRQLLAGITTLVILGGMVGTVSALKRHQEASQDKVATATAQLPPAVSQPEAPSPETTAETPAAATQEPAPVAQAPSALATTYKNGTYTATGSYVIPGGEAEQVGVMVRVDGDAIADVTITKMANNRESREYQSYFADDIKSYVVGKPLSSISVSRVSGSSLTSKGFNSAIAKIRDQAKG